MNNLFNELHESEHLVQFYEDDAFLIDQVAEFISARPESDNTGVIIATNAHQEALQRRLATGLSRMPAG